MTRAAFEPDTYESDPFEPRSRRREGLLARLGPVGIAAIVAGLLMAVGISAVAYSIVNSPQGPLQGQVATDQPTAVEPAPDPRIPTEPSVSPLPSAKASAAAVAGDAGQEAAAVQLINRARAQAQSRCRQGLRLDGRLRTAARTHSADMAKNNFFSHTGSDRSSADDRMRAAGYPDPLTENLARGSRSANDIVNAWLRNPGNRRNLLDCDARAVGVGVAITSGVAYWTVNLGR